MKNDNYLLRRSIENLRELLNFGAETAQKILDAESYEEIYKNLFELSKIQKDIALYDIQI